MNVRKPVNEDLFLDHSGPARPVRQGSARELGSNLGPVSRRSTTMTSNSTPLLAQHAAHRDVQQGAAIPRRDDDGHVHGVAQGRPCALDPQRLCTSRHNQGTGGVNWSSIGTEDW